MATMRENSKAIWNGDGTFNSINAGSLQRIADATELMAKNWQRLQQDIDYYKDLSRKLTLERDSLKRSLTGHRSAISRLKKKLAALSELPNPDTPKSELPE
ncbi:MAG: hypothetical protein KF752_11875 [Pirellulaceae bacterium]|nr:hypothetical protein [Pirellulaceae bacterium]